MQAEKHLGIYKVLTFEVDGPQQQIITSSSACVSQVQESEATVVTGFLKLDS